MGEKQKPLTKAEVQRMEELETKQGQPLPIVVGEKPLTEAEMRRMEKLKTKQGNAKRKAIGKIVTTEKPETPVQKIENAELDFSPLNGIMVGTKVSFEGTEYEVEETPCEHSAYKYVLAFPGKKRRRATRENFLKALNEGRLVLIEKPQSNVVVGAEVKEDPEGVEKYLASIREEGLPRIDIQPQNPPKISNPVIVEDRLEEAHDETTPIATPEPEIMPINAPAGVNEEFDEQGEKIETIPKTPEEQVVVKEIENLSEKEKLGFWKNLKTIGFFVEENKNKFFANVFGKIVKTKEGSRDKNDAQGTLERFCRQMRNDHKLSAEEAKRKKEAVIKGEGSWKIKTFRNTQNAGFLVKDIFRYGRVVADFTGYTVASSMRYWMMASMAINSLSKTAKEARFANTKLIDQTRINAEKAAEEAWKIYEKAGGEFGEDGHSKGVSSEALKNAYLKEMPKDLQERLKNPDTANNFVEKIIAGAIEKGVGALQKHIEKIKNDPKLSEEQKKQKEMSALKFFEAELVDYDRMITQVGTVDQLALWAHVTQKISKGVVYATTAQTILITAEHLFTGLSNIFSNHHDVDVSSHTGNTTTIAPDQTHTPPIADHDAHTPPLQHDNPPINHPEVQNNLPHTPENAAPKLPGQPEINPGAAPVNDFHGASITFEHGHGFISGIRHLQAEYLKHLQENHIDPSKAPAWTHEDPTKLAKELGGYDPNAADGKESLLVLKGSTLNVDAEGNLHYVASGQDNVLIHGDTSQVEKIHGVMKHTVHHDASLDSSSHPVESHLSETGKDLTSLHEVDHLKQTIIQQLDNAQNSNPVVGNSHGVGDDALAFPNDTGSESHLTDQLGNGGHTMHMHGFKFTAAEGNLVRQNPGLVKFIEDSTTHNLNFDQLVRSYDAYIYNIHVLGENLWQQAKNVPVNKMLNHVAWENDPAHLPVMNHLHKLIEVTGLKPKTGFFGIKPESAEHYIVRATEKATIDGKLAEIKLEK